MQKDRPLLIIRVCPKDDYLAYMCYKSFMEVTGGKFDCVFFAENGVYKWISQLIVPIWNRDSCANFGGQAGLYACINKLKEASRINYKIIFVDADVIFFKNPLLIDCDFGGVRSSTNPRHFSGQCLIFSKWLWDKVMNYEGYDKLIQDFVDSGTIDVADDTCMSWVATEYTTRTYDFYNKGFWLHEKNYQLEPK